MKNYQRYPEYKDSGIEWIGKVPTHWITWKVTHSFTRIGSGTTPKSDNPRYYDGEIPWVTTSELREKPIYDTQIKVTEEAMDDYPTLKLYKKGALIIAMYGATIGRLGTLEVDATVNQACCVFAEPEQFDAKYFYYWLWMRRPILISLSMGGGQPNLSQDDLKQIRAPIPDIEEQKRIAYFLDFKTKQIDQLIEKKKALIKKLKEQRIAVITRTVTKGLDETVPMEDSGVDWLGQVPVHWDIRRLKFIVYLRNIKLTVKEFDLPYIGLENIESFTGRKIINELDEPESEGIGSLFFENDVLFGKLRPYLAKGYIADSKGICSTEFLVMKPIEVTSKFLLYYILSRGFINIVNASTYGVKMPRANWDYIGNLPCLVPKEEEQYLIIEFVEREVEKIDGMLKINNFAINKLEEYRTALITAAVTGKIDVRNFKYTKDG